jgi:hypothetical protein
MCTLVKLGQYLREREVNFGLAKDRLCYFNEDLTRLSAVLVEMVDFESIFRYGDVFFCEF